MFHKTAVVVLEYTIKPSSQLTTLFITFQKWAVNNSWFYSHTVKRIKSSADKNVDEQGWIHRGTCFAEPLHLYCLIKAGFTIITARVRSTTRGCLFTPVCPSTGGRRVPQSMVLYPSLPPPTPQTGPGQGFPHQIGPGQRYPPQTDYAAGGTLLAVTQEDFLVIGIPNVEDGSEIITKFLCCCFQSIRLTNGVK